MFVAGSNFGRLFLMNYLSESFKYTQQNQNTTFALRLKYALSAF